VADKSFEERNAERLEFWRGATEHDITTTESRTRDDLWGERGPRGITLVECPICCALVASDMFGERLDQHAAWHQS